MARKTFISYKYSESRGLRDRIIQALGEDAKYYNGENGFSPDLTSYKANTIKEYLKDMIYNTSVTIVILSPHMRESEWIDWEIEYSLKRISRNERTSKTNGVVCVVKKELYYGYGWFKDICGNWDMKKTFPIIGENRNNLSNIQALYKGLALNYIDIVTEDDFLRNPAKYIEEAHKKAENVEYYKISKVIA